MTPRAIFPQSSMFERRKLKSDAIQGFEKQQNLKISNNHCGKKEHNETNKNDKST